MMGRSSEDDSLVVTIAEATVVSCIHPQLFSIATENLRVLAHLYHRAVQALERLRSMM